MSVLVLIALSLLAAPATADEDADRAYRALERGEVRPLADILTTLERRLQGEVVGVEFESEDGRHVYEFEVVTPGGRLLEIYVDAATGRILEREDDD
ncbi:MAG: peptidase [Deinococcus-Thermus bacterium]|nr:peptidase [Deinococcota bacterium]